jgi:[acyl-carrier-protein] S-malonyltransferase
MKTASWNLTNKTVLSENRIAFVFPAFISGYKDDPSARHQGFLDIFGDFLGKASLTADPDLSSFHPELNPMTGDELRNQYLSYIYGCSCAVYLRSAGINPSFLAGYSMGIYAALYVAGSISFETGLSLVGFAYHSIRNSIPEGFYGMCGVIGLTDTDLRDIFHSRNLELQIVNRNSDYSFILAGPAFHVRSFISIAGEEGALHARSLEVGIPYHTTILDSASDAFRQHLIKEDISVPSTPVISVLGQDELNDAERIRKELWQNLCTPFNWQDTQLSLAAKGIQVFTECGPSLSLQKNSKFITGAGKFISWDKLAISNQSRH